MRRLLPLLVAAVLLAAGCSGDDGGSDTDSSTDSTAASGGTSIEDVTVTGELGEHPTVEFPTPLDVEETERTILVEGDGELTEEGMSVTFEHVSLDGRTGEEFDSSYEQQPTAAILDDTQVIPGLVQGLTGVPIGSRVLVTIAPDDAFGPRGGIPEVGIEADDSIVYVVDVQDASFPLTRAEGTPVEPDPGLPAVTLADDGEPTVEIPDHAPPRDLLTRPLIEGEGPEVTSGQTITAHYKGLVWRTGETFDSSWERGQPSQFQIGVGQVVRGWDEGLIGQPVGSQVLLVIPPEFGYGSAGNAEIDVNGNDVMVFVVDILAAA